MRGVSTSFIRTGPPRAAIRSNCSASGTDNAAAGIGFTPSGKLVVAGMRKAVMVGADRTG
ncbi:Uncharacterised protein [Sphingomonas paucimobilis]|nr:Uncharacterised protein [Sphingomonas paucimobilis]